MRILVVEDDLVLGSSLKRALGLSGYGAEWVQDGEEAEIAVETSEFDLIVLDLNLPVLSGLDFLQNLRKKSKNTPVLILTALNSATAMVKGLDLGADDYVTKPFDLDSLLARIRALIRRGHGRAEVTFKSGDVELNPATKTVTYKNKTILLSAKEYQVLHHLMQSTGRVVSKAAIEEIIYGWEEGFESNTVEVLIYKLRKKFGSNFIKTIRNMGYTIKK